MLTKELKFIRKDVKLRVVDTTEFTPKQRYGMPQ